MMRQSLKFGFLAGMLAGTAAVGTVGLMMGQAEARVSPKPIHQPLKLELTQSPDGKTAYPWGINPIDRTVTFLGSDSAGHGSKGRPGHNPPAPAERHLDPGGGLHHGQNQEHAPGKRDG